MEIIIGRDQQTRQLCIIKDGNSRLYGQANSVPMDMSRHHISLVPVGSGKWKIRNLNALNVTFVNGIAVESKTISESDKVELGNSHYLFPWVALQEPKEETVDIRPLKKVWDDYKNKTSELNMAAQKFNIARSATGIVTMLAIACGFIIGHGPIYIFFYGIAITLSLCFLYVVMNTKKNLIVGGSVRNVVVLYKRKIILFYRNLMLALTVRRSSISNFVQ